MVAEDCEVWTRHMRTTVCVLVAQFCLTLCDPMDAKAPLSMKFSRQEYLNELP